jgi:hypothetical protein
MPRIKGISVQRLAVMAVSLVGVIMMAFGLLGQTAQPGLTTNDRDAFVSKAIGSLKSFAILDDGVKGFDLKEIYDKSVMQGEATPIPFMSPGGKLESRMLRLSQSDTSTASQSTNDQSIAAFRTMIASDSPDMTAVFSISPQSIIGFTLMPSSGGWSFVEPLQPLLLRQGFAADELAKKYNITSTTHIAYNAADTSFRFDMPETARPGSPALTRGTLPENYAGASFPISFNGTVGVQLVADQALIKYFNSLGIDWQSKAGQWLSFVNAIFSDFNPNNTGGFRIQLSPKEVSQLADTSLTTGFFKDDSGLSTTPLEIPGSLVVFGGEKPLVIPGSGAAEVGQSITVPVYFDSANAKLGSYDLSVALATSIESVPVGHITGVTFQGAKAGTYKISEDGYSVEITGTQDSVISENGHLVLGNVVVQGDALGSNAIQVDVKDIKDQTGAPITLDESQSYVQSKEGLPRLDAPLVRPTGTLMIIPVGALAASASQPALIVGNAEVSAGGTVEVPLKLSSAPQGLSSYQMRLALLWPEIAETAGVSFSAMDGSTFISIENDPQSLWPNDRSYIVLGATDVLNRVQAGTQDVEVAKIAFHGLRRGSSLVLVEANYVNPLDLMCRMTRSTTSNADLVHFLTGFDMVRMSHNEMGDTFSGFPARNVDFVGIADGIGGIGVAQSSCPDLYEMPHNPADHSLTQHGPNINALGSNYQGLLVQDMLVMAHEFGHNFGAFHDDDANEPSDLQVCFRGTDFCGKPIMSQVIDQSVIPLFSPRSTLEITNRVKQQFEAGLCCKGD